MGYTLPNLNDAKMNDNEFMNNLNRLQSAIEERRKKQCYEIGAKTSGIISGTTYVCQQPEYVDAYDSQGRSCARVLSSVQQRQSDYDAWSNATINSLRNENQKLMGELQKLIAERRQLIDYINNLNKENEILKGKKEKKKDFDVKVYNSFNKAGNMFTSIYQKFIAWLNT